MLRGPFAFWGVGVQSKRLLFVRECLMWSLRRYTIYRYYCSLRLSLAIFN